eukprot:6497727-Ditylum_brightwellii.AAC.1
MELRPAPCLNTHLQPSTVLPPVGSNEPLSTLSSTTQAVSIDFSSRTELLHLTPVDTPAWCFLPWLQPVSPCLDPKQRTPLTRKLSHPPGVKELHPRQPTPRHPTP